MSSKRARVYPSPSAAAAMGTLSRVGTFAWPLVAECLDVDGWAILGNTCRELRRTVVKIQEQIRKLCVALDVASNSTESVSLNATGKWWRLFNDFTHTTKELILRLRSSLTTLHIKMDDEQDDPTRSVFNATQDAERWSMIQGGLTTLIQAPGLLELNLERCFTWDWFEDAERPPAWLRDAMQQLILASGTSCRLQRLILNPCINQAIFLPPVTWKAQVCSSLRSITCSLAWLKFLTKSPATMNKNITSICLDGAFTGTSLAEALAFCNMETFPALRRLHFALSTDERLHFEGWEPHNIPTNRLHEFSSYTNLPNVYEKNIGRILAWPGLEWFVFHLDDSALRWDALRRRLDVCAKDDPTRLEAVQVNWLNWCRKDLPPHEFRLISDTSSLKMVQQVPDCVWIASWSGGRPAPSRIMDNVKSLIVGVVTFFMTDNEFEISDGAGSFSHMLDADDFDCLSTFFPDITSLTLSISEADVFRRRLRRKQDPSLTWLKRIESDDYWSKLQTAIQRWKLLEHFSIVIGKAEVWSGHKRTDWTWSFSIQLPANLDSIISKNWMWLAEVVNDWKALFG
jgi:hypothetical protein